MHIVVTNDDGVVAPGLLALALEMRKLGTVSILAPDRNWLASGHVRTLDRPLRAREVILADSSIAWACDGAPSDCVALALCGFFSEPVDLVVSGINPYANIGDDVTYSGTVTAAMEAVIGGLPAVAVSVDSPDNHLGIVDYQASAQMALKITSSMLLKGLPKGLLLNINVPYLPFEKIKGIRVTRQGNREYHDRLDKRLDPRGKPYYWAIGDAPTAHPEPGNDAEALINGYVSVTPIQLDLTAYRFLPEMNSWNWEESQNFK
jgi:5'-nucleotidase